MVYGLPAITYLLWKRRRASRRPELGHRRSLSRTAGPPRSCCVATNLLLEKRLHCPPTSTHVSDVRSPWSGPLATVVLDVSREQLLDRRVLQRQVSIFLSLGLAAVSRAPLEVCVAADVGAGGSAPQSATR